MMIFDTHAHYDDAQFDNDREELLDSMVQSGVGTIVNVASDLASWDAIRRLTSKYPFIYGAAGLHPDYAADLDDENFERLKALLKEDKFVAAGEIGLDYYWDKADRDLQKKAFIRQLNLAKELGLPVIIHSREAAADTMQIMKEYAKGMGGVIHCYSYSLEQAREYVRMGFYIGVGGVVTFKNAKKLREVVLNLPLEALVLETDCPYLAPVPYRGKRNSSLYLPLTAREIARIKGVSYEEVVSQTEINAVKLYRLQEKS